MGKLINHRSLLYPERTSRAAYSTPNQQAAYSTPSEQAALLILPRTNKPGCLFYPLMNKQGCLFYPEPTSRAAYSTHSP
ncbi:MAG: hypothetical protein ACPGWR_06780 [Ardenticatenaceae bacterium]